MKVSVKGKQLDVGDALRSHVEQSLEHILTKYFGNAMEAQVTLTRDAHLYRANLQAHVGRQIQLAAQGEADQPYQAFDTAAERLSKRLRRYKRRLRDHHKEGATDGEILSAQQYVLAGESAQSEDGEEDGAETSDQPVVVAEMTTEIPSLTVSQAVMRLDLAELQALLFRNQAHGELNMIYRRPDGNIGWVDPLGNRGD